MHFTRASAYRLLLAIVMASLLIVGVRPFVVRSQANQLSDRSVTIQSPLQSATTSYRFNFQIASASTVGSIRFQFCSDTPLIDEPCAIPAGFDGQASTLQTQSGETGFAVLAPTSDNVITLTRTAAPAAAAPVSYTFDNVTNPSVTGSYYVRIQTYASQGATGTATDYGGLSYVINDRISISTTVPPYLLLCDGVEITGYDCATASGHYINFGELSSSATKSAQSQILLATNAQSGYGVYLDGATMASGTDVIDALDRNDVSRPGKTQFGLNLATNTTPAIGEDASGPGAGSVQPNYAVPDQFRFVPGDLLASAPGTSDYCKYTISYIINIKHNQPPGLYISTLSYVAVANF